MPTRQIPNHPSRRETDSDRQVRIRGRKPSALYGAVEPETGQRFPAEHERLNSDCFQVFLDRFVEAFPRSHNVMILDNGRFHKAKELSIPTGVQLKFLPPYSPELNLAQRL
ncbi:MAG: hypothetical protein BRD53_07680 [Bacteroidetes bacterium SW_7_64_58]|nr:MAG: hypothetical protein BRD53_07680 [Bacteroidetes bacterium SW_7_64_58]